MVRVLSYVFTSEFSIVHIGNEFLFFIISESSIPDAKIFSLKCLDMFFRHINIHRGADAAIVQCRQIQDIYGYNLTLNLIHNLPNMLFLRFHKHINFANH